MLLDAPDLLVRLVDPPPEGNSLEDRFHTWMKDCLASGVHPQSILDSLHRKLHAIVEERDTK